MFPVLCWHCKPRSTPQPVFAPSSHRGFGSGRRGRWRGCRPLRRGWGGGGYRGWGGGGYRGGWGGGGVTAAILEAHMARCGRWRRRRRRRILVAAARTVRGGGRRGEAGGGGPGGAAAAASRVRVRVALPLRAQHGGGHLLHRAGSAHRAQQAQAQARAMGAAAAAAQAKAEGAVAEAAAARARVDEAAKADAAKAVETVTAATYGSECPLS